MKDAQTQTGMKLVVKLGDTRLLVSHPPSLPAISPAQRKLLTNGFIDSFIFQRVSCIGVLFNQSRLQ